jgi:hypothetical protein
MKTWFDVEVRDGSGMDTDEFRRYAVEADSQAEAEKIALKHAIPNLTTQTAPLYTTPSDAGLDYDAVIAAEETAPEPTSDVYELIPIRTSADTLKKLSPEQLDRALKLARDFKAGSITLQGDNWGGANVEFRLHLYVFDDVVLAGLIEPDGRSHT